MSDSPSTYAGTVRLDLRDVATIIQQCERHGYPVKSTAEAIRTVVRVHAGADKKRFRSTQEAYDFLHTRGLYSTHQGKANHSSLMKQLGEEAGKGIIPRGMGSAQGVDLLTLATGVVEGETGPAETPEAAEFRRAEEDRKQREAMKQLSAQDIEFAGE